MFGIFEVMHAPAAGQQFVDRLRATQEHQAKQHDLGRHQFHGLVDAMLPAVGPAAHDQAGQALAFECAQALADLTLGQVGDRFAAGFLVAGQH
ncbi:hypothetical protein D3C80_931930 [compost metagenome]